MPSAIRCNESRRGVGPVPDLRSPAHVDALVVVPRVHEDRGHPGWSLEERAEPSSRPGQGLSVREDDEHAVSRLRREEPWVVIAPRDSRLVTRRTSEWTGGGRSMPTAFCSVAWNDVSRPPAGKRYGSARSVTDAIPERDGRDRLPQLDGLRLGAREPGGRTRGRGSRASSGSRRGRRMPPRPSALVALVLRDDRLHRGDTKEDGRRTSATRGRTRAAPRLRARCAPHTAPDPVRPEECEERNEHDNRDEPAHRCEEGQLHRPSPSTRSRPRRRPHPSRPCRRATGSCRRRTRRCRDPSSARASARG